MDEPYALYPCAVGHLSAWQAAREGGPAAARAAFHDLARLSEQYVRVREAAYACPDHPRIPTGRVAGRGAMRTLHAVALSSSGAAARELRVVEVDTAAAERAARGGEALDVELAQNLGREKRRRVRRADPERRGGICIVCARSSRRT